LFADVHIHAYLPSRHAVVGRTLELRFSVTTAQPSTAVVYLRTLAIVVGVLHVN
jgi:hypothetical protein